MESLISRNIFNLILYNKHTGDIIKKFDNPEGITEKEINDFVFGEDNGY